MAAEFEIQLRDVMMYGRHGVMQEEGILGNQYRINVRLHIDAANFDGEADDLSNTISYAEIYEILQYEMSKPAALLETVAVRFAKKVSEKWQILKSGEIEIVKTVPPIPGMIGEAGISYRF